MNLDALQQAVAFIKSQTETVPAIALVLGSGLGDLAEDIEGVAIPYSDIPGFPVSTAPSHTGLLHIGKLYGRSVVAMQGRVHLYEGYTPQEIAFPIRVMGLLGAQTLVLTNAAGGLNPELAVGDLVAVQDHLSLANLGGADPLRGENLSELGPRFISLNKAYTPHLIDLAYAAGKALDINIRRGVYAFAAGPTFETPAEVRLLRLAGCDVVGMSTVPEVIAARHMGLDVLTISSVTNMAVSTVDDPHITNEEEVWDAVEIIKPRLRKLMADILPKIPAQKEIK